MRETAEYWAGMCCRGEDEGRGLFARRGSSRWSMVLTIPDSTGHVQGLSCNRSASRHIHQQEEQSRVLHSLHVRGEPAVCALLDDPLYW